MKGLGTDEKAIIKAITNISNAQRQEVKAAFKTMYGKDLIHDLKSELGGDLEKAVLALMKRPFGYDAYSMRNAMEGVGTDESVLVEILSTRTNAEINDLKAQYAKQFSRDLEKDIMSETSGHFKRILVSLVQGMRREDDAVDEAKAEQQAKALFEAGEGKFFGTDESAFNRVFMTSSRAQLQAVFKAYRKISGYDIYRQVEKEMSGNLEDAFLALIEGARNLPKYFAKKLYKSMKGVGTDEETLVRILVSRSEIDLEDIKEAFMDEYNKSLAKMIKDDLGGKFEKILLALVEPDKY